MPYNIENYQNLEKWRAIFPNCFSSFSVLNRRLTSGNCTFHPTRDCYTTAREGKERVDERSREWAGQWNRSLVATRSTGRIGRAWIYPSKTALGALWSNRGQTNGCLPLIDTAGARHRSCPFVQDRARSCTVPGRSHAILLQARRWKCPRIS